MAARHGLAQPSGQPSRELVEETGAFLTALAQSADPLMTSDASRLVAAFDSSASSSDRRRITSLAYLALSAALAREGADVVAGDGNGQVAGLLSLFEPVVRSSLADTDAAAILSALSFLIAVSQLSPSLARSLLSAPALLSSALEAADTANALPGRIYDVRCRIAELLSAFVSNKEGRATLTATDGGEAVRWLEDASRCVGEMAKGADDDGARLKASAAVALTKLQAGGAGEADGGPVTWAAGKGEAERLADMFKGLVLSSSLAQPPKGMAKDGQAPQSLLSALEGLVYLCLRPAIKDALSRDISFLHALFALLPSRSRKSVFPSLSSVNTGEMSSSSAYDDMERKVDSISGEGTDAAMLFAVSTIILHLVSYKTPQSSEDAQMERLRAMAKAKSATTPSGAAGKVDTDNERNHPLNSDEAVHARVQRLLKADLLPALVGTGDIAVIPDATTVQLGPGSRRRSDAVRKALGKIWLAVVERKEERGVAIQGGALKALLRLSSAVMANLAPPSGKPRPDLAEQQSQQQATTLIELSADDLAPLQALAKLAITSPPPVLFGPSPASVLPALLPLGVLLVHPVSTLLQQFEALMALTNLASVGAEVPMRISTLKVSVGGSTKRSVDGPASSKANGSHQRFLLEEIEARLLDENYMVRRAATELTCNLVGCEEVFVRYTGEDDAPSSDGSDPSPSAAGKDERGEGRAPSRSASQLHLLLALSTVRDLPTRLAASGALATLACSPRAAKTIIGLGKKRVEMVVDLVVPSRFREISASGDENGAQAGGDEENGEDVSPSGPAREAALIGLRHRGVEILRAIVASGAVKPASTELEVLKEAGVVEALKTVVVETKVREIVMPAVVALKGLVALGVKV